MKNKHENRKQFVSQKSTIKLDWFELLDLKYVLRDYLRDRFQFKNRMEKLFPNESFDIILVNDKRIIELYKQIIHKLNSYN